MTSLPIPRAIRGSAIAPFVASLVVSALLIGALAARPPSTLALSCIQPPPVEEAVASAEIAFVGTVTAAANLGRWATISVEEVWAGSDLPAVVEVRGGGAAGAESMADRSYVVGTRYLFFPYVEEGRLTDNICSSTQEWQPEVEKVRPADVRTPTSGEPEPVDPVAALGGLVVPIVGVAVLAIVIIGGAMLVARRQT